MNQREAFHQGEGDCWFQRNGAVLHMSHATALKNPASDPVLAEIGILRPQRLLEVGCSNGWRLDAARQLFGCDVIGIEPSQQAIRDGMARFPDVQFVEGDASRLLQFSGVVDCVVFGFCLYLCDRTDLFQIAREADRVLADGGHLIIYDFYPVSVYRNPYSHRPGVFSYKMDHSALWSWHPHYVRWSHRVLAHPGADPDDQNERLAVTVLKKLVER